MSSIPALQSPVISLRDMKKSYGSFELGPVDLTIEPGHIVVLVGPNGSGKSTLFEILMNLVKPDSGEVRLFGDTYLEDEVPIKQRVGYVPELSVGHDDMSAKSLGRFVSRWYPRWDERLYKELLGRPGMEPGKRYARLSRGMQRRVSFALAASTGAELLLLDEPAAGLDPFARKEMLEDISRFMHDDSDRKTVVFATQVMEEVRRLADYVAFLVNGEFLGLYRKDALLQRWKTLWVNGEPEANTPGVVDVERGSPTRIVTDAPEETTRALLAQGIRIVRKGTSDLEEILSQLMRQSRQGSRA